MKVAVFTPVLLRDLFQETIDASVDPDRFVIHTYVDFEDLERLFLAHRQEIAGALFTGNLPYTYLHMLHPDTTMPMVHVENYSLLYACLLLIRHQKEQPEIPLSQVFCDFLGEEKAYSLFREVLPAAEMPHTISAAYLSRDFVRGVTDTVRELYKAGKVEKAILTVSTLYESLDQAGIPCELVPIRPEYIKEALGHIVDLVDGTSGQRQSLLLALVDFARAGGVLGNYEEMQYREITLMKHLVDYRKTVSGQFAPTIISGNGKIEIILAAATGGQMLEPMDRCLKHLLDCTDLPIAVGVGVGAGLNDCQTPANEALQYAHEFGGSCVFVKQHGQLTGPLYRPECLTIDASLIATTAAMAKKLKISSTNYNRLLTLMIKENVTSAKVAEFLNITQRSANRIISTLLEHHILEEAVDPQAQGSVGRPSRHYTMSNRVNILPKNE